MRYPVAERFKAPQGEGLYTGTPMAFIRLVGCSVGKGVCTACDTNFEEMHEQLGGGLFTPEELLEWVGDFEHICITGGEPLDRDLIPLLSASRRKLIHIESSGTVDWIPPYLPIVEGQPRFSKIWLTISPKPGWLQKMITQANEVKVIIGGLGDGPGWPTLDDAVEWANKGKLVYLQPRNEKFTINRVHMAYAIDCCMENPNLRLSAQLHKYISTR